MTNDVEQLFIDKVFFITCVIDRSFLSGCIVSLQSRIESFKKQKSLISVKSSLSNFCFMGHAFSVVVRTLCLNHSHKDLPFFFQMFNSLRFHI